MFAILPKRDLSININLVQLTECVRCIQSTARSPAAHNAMCVCCVNKQMVCCYLLGLPRRDHQSPV